MAHPRNEREGSLAKERRIKRNKTRFVVCMAVLVVFVGVVTFLLCWQKMYIRDIRISGTRFADDEMVLNTIRTYLDRSMFGVVPRWHMYLTGDAKLKKTLTDSFPLFTDIAIHAKKQVLSVTVVEREATYLWCNDSAETPSCAYMNTEGVLFSEAPYFSKTSRMVFYTKTHTIGEQAVAPEIIQKVDSYNDLLKAVGFTIHQVTLNDFYVHIVGKFIGNAAEDVVIMIDPTEDPATVTSYVEVLMKDSEFKKAFTARKIQYIDARFGKILYYRFD